MAAYVVGFQEIDKSKRMLVGGKGANLGELSKIQGIQVPGGFCVTTDAYRKIIGNNQNLKACINDLSLIRPDERDRIGARSAEIRNVIEGITIPEDVADEISHWLVRLGEQLAYAVRSSATAEDLPLASFAGQHDTYLNIIGRNAILAHISKCWASLFTDRAVIYRIQNGYDHHKVYVSVVIQQMIFPQASGIVFTADPVTSNRKVLSIDASFGLGEALVSGLVNADTYKVRNGLITEKKISVKSIAVHALANGGTQVHELEEERQHRQTLTDKQIVQLEGLGRRIEDHFGSPQDIEWGLYNDAFFFLQSRPITTLYPIPEVHDDKMHVFMSVGHQQMMTDAIRPLGLSFFQLLGSDQVPIGDAGGRFFFDLTHDLASPLGRKIVVGTMGSNDPLTHSALLNLIKRKSLIKSLPRGKRYIRLGTEYFSWGLPLVMVQVYRKNDPALVQTLMSRNELSILALQKRIAHLSGEELFAFIVEDHKELKEIMYGSSSIAIIMVGLYASNWINKHMEKWLGEKSAADTLSQSVANNVTSEMGLDLLDVADVVREAPAAIQYLQHATDDTFFEDLTQLAGGDAVGNSIQDFLDKYGMRCSGEIDITRNRWSEQPTALIPMILNNIKNFEPHAHRAMFQRGQQKAKQKETELITRIAELPGGKRKAQKTTRMVSTLRNFIGYREYPKYALIQRYFVYKQALLKEAARLTQKGILRDKEDIFYLSFGELREVVRTSRLDYDVIARRKKEYEIYEKLSPPRLITSEGEVIPGEYDTGQLPHSALPGLPVSSGVIEGRARVIFKIQDASIEDGDILVTTYTDPSWTPLFVSIRGLVTEVGGLMTHGAVIAREYGLPAVVGVENAVKLIRDGQRIRVNGTEGYVEIL